MNWAIRIFLAAGFIASAAAEDRSWRCDRSPLLIENVRLLSSDDDAIFIKDGFIAWVGPVSARPLETRNARVVDAAGATALPGLIDSHTHFDALPAAQHLQETLNVQLQIFPITMRQTLASGVTTARTHLAALEDMKLMKAASADECFPAPRMALSGPGLLGGAPAVNARLMRGVAGPDDARAKVRQLADKGAKWAALHGITRFDEAALAAIIEAAAEADMKLMADTNGFDRLASALSLPIVSGEYIDRSLEPSYPDAVIDAVKARETPFYVTPPIGYYARSAQSAAASELALASSLFLFIDPDISAEMRATFADAFANDAYIRQTVQAFPTLRRKFDQLKSSGAIFVIGSDAGSLGQFHHDAIWREMAAWKDFGATPEEIVAAATSVPAQMLDEADIGALAPGMRGDIVLYTSDIANGVFSREAVGGVIKGGVVYVENGAWTGPNDSETRRAIKKFIKGVSE